MAIRPRHVRQQASPQLGYTSGTKLSAYTLHHLFGLSTELESARHHQGWRRSSGCLRQMSVLYIDEMLIQHAVIRLVGPKNSYVIQHGIYVLV